MQLSDLNPFIRYSYKITMQPKAFMSVAVDCRLFYVLKGEGTVYAAGEEHTFKAGTLMMWQQGIPYRFMSADPAEIVSINFDLTCGNKAHTMPYELIHFDEEPVRRDLPQPVEFTDCASLNVPIILSDCSDMFGDLNAILAERTSQMRYCEEKSSAMLKNFIIETVRRHEIQISTGRTDSRLDKVVKYIHEHYREPLTNGMLAALVNYHPYYLNRVFVAAKGKTLHQYLLQLRISAAEQLLITTDKPISEVAYEVGFNSALSFSSAFKSKNGMSPAAFRSKYYNSL